MQEACMDQEENIVTRMNKDLNANKENRDDLAICPICQELPKCESNQIGSTLIRCKCRELFFHFPLTISAAKKEWNRQTKKLYKDFGACYIGSPAKEVGK